MKIAIFGYYGMGNIGDEAILEGLKGLLKDTFQNCEIIVFGKGNLFPFGLRSFIKAIFNRKKWKLLKSQLLSCDLVVIGGGGLFTDEERPFTALFWALQGLYAIYLKKPVLCLGISIGKINPISHLLVKKFFLKSRLITVRDKKSKDLLTKWSINSYETSDLALLSPYVPNRNTVKKKYIVISVKRFRDSEEKLYTIFAHLCDFIVEKYGLDIILLPFQDGDSFDAYIMNKIYVQCEHKESIFVERFRNDISQVLDILANSEALVGMRLHSGIFSVLVGTPFLPIGYMSKVGNFWEEFPEIRCVPLEDISLCNLKSAFENLWKNKENFKTNLKNIKSGLMGKALQIHELLTDKVA